MFSALLLLGLRTQTVPIEGIDSIAALNDGGFVVGHRPSPATPAYFLSFFDGQGKPSGRVPINPHESLVGVDGEGRAVLWSPEQTFRVATRSGARSSANAPYPFDYSFLKNWILEQRGDQLLILDKGKLRFFLDDVFESDSYAVDPASGAVFVLRDRRRGVSFSTYGADGKPRRRLSLKSAEGTVTSAFPDCTAAYVDGKSAILYLGFERPAASKEKSESVPSQTSYALCLVSLEDGKVRPLLAIEGWSGDLPRPLRGRFALLTDGRIAVCLQKGVKIIEKPIL